MIKRVLLTGASGFLGRALGAQLVQQGIEVHGLTRGIRGYKLPGIILHDYDLLSSTPLEPLLSSIDATCIIHTAWHTDHSDFWTSSKNIAWLSASLRLFQAFISCGGSCIVGIGSCAEYDWSFGFLNEQRTPLAPSSLYGAAKSSLARITEFIAAEYGVKFIWPTLFWLFGEHENPNRFCADLISSLLKDEVFTISNGEFIRDYLSVADAAEAIIATIESNILGRINIASGIPVSLKDFANSIADHLGLRASLRFSATSKVTPAFPLIVADTTRLRSEVGWKPSVNPADRIQATISWHRHQRHHSV